MTPKRPLDSTLALLLYLGSASWAWAQTGVRPMEDPTSKTIFVAPSPYGTVEALVEQNERVASFYLVPLALQERGEMYYSWVRNLVPAPLDFDVESLDQGIEPLLPQQYCRHSKGAEPLAAEDLRVLWLPSGDGAALYENDELLAYIPPWSGRDGFTGYARDASERSPIAWPLSQARDAVEEQLAEAEAFWKAWSADPNPWHQTQPRLIEAAEKVLGPHTRYAAIDGRKWPHKGMAYFEREDLTILVTLGVSLYPQPRVGLTLDDPFLAHRIELALALPHDASEKLLDECGSALSGLASFPWTYLTFLGHGHTIPFDCFPPLPDGSALPGAVLTTRPKGVPNLTFPDVSGDPVNVLWVVPITEKERQFATSNGSEELLSFLKHVAAPRF